VNNQLIDTIQNFGANLNLDHIGIAGIDLKIAEARLLQWLEFGWHGDMEFMARYGVKRSQPAQLLPGTLRVISARLNYLSVPTTELIAQLADPNCAYIACYARGRDYHKLLRKRLQRLAEQIATVVTDFNYRVYVDSAPVMEKPLAELAGLGWVGKHTNLVNRYAGSWFFLGEIYTNLTLPVTTPAINHCGSCRACVDACPTKAIVAPYCLDATKCLAYLTIESHSSIPKSLRPLLGNRIFGCDDCQLVCPWNRFAKLTTEADFKPRQPFIHANLIDLFAWTEAEFLRYTEGSTIRRLGWQRWLRNLAVALGNAPPNMNIVKILHTRLQHPNIMVQEHVQWALAKQLKL
jgi:epoxyqueuosine reductase